MPPHILKLIFIVIALAYFLWPLDIIPDIVGLLGRLDDLLIIGFLLWRYRKYLHTHYREMFEEFQRIREGEIGSQQQRSSSEPNQEPPRKRTSYEILELTPDATQEQISKQYRKLVKQYHPDRVAHLGAEFQELAHDKMLELQEAYEHLTKSM